MTRWRFVRGDYASGISLVTDNVRCRIVAGLWPRSRRSEFSILAGSLAP